jgi:hypothetical protein
MFTTIICNLEGLKMNKIKIQRTYYDDCTVGRLWCGDFQCFTLELPLLNNQTNVSCIYPAGGYRGNKHFSPSNGDCIAINNVMDRTNIQIHSGNYTSQIRGCILVGDSIKFLNDDNTPDVTNSKKTLATLMSILPNSFNVEIL